MEIGKIMSIAVVIVILALTFAKNAVSAEKAEDKNIPLFTNMRFIDYITTKNGITAARYCSALPAATILKFYRSNLKNALEIQEGSSKGIVYKLLLDVRSPLKWRDARKFIEISSDNQRPECGTIVHITETSKPAKDGGQMSAMKKDAPASAVPVESYSSAYSPQRKFVGVGVFSNTLNFSAGPTLILWPLENLAIQGYYGVGTFTSYEARMFYRFNIFSSVNPYIGASYLHVEKDVTAIGVNTKIQGDNFSILGGFELPVYKGLFAYIEASGTPMKLEKNVANGTREAKVKVEYSQATVGAGLVFYFW